MRKVELNPSLKKLTLILSEQESFNEFAFSCYINIVMGSELSLKTSADPITKHGRLYASLNSC